MNTTIGKRGLLAATIAGLFSVGAQAQQACQNDVQQVRNQLEQSQLGEQPREQVEDLLSRAATAGAQTCDALVMAARQRLNEAQDPGSLQARQQSQPGQQPQPGQQSQAGQGAQPGLEQQQAGERQQGQQPGQQQAQARQGAPGPATTQVQVEQPAANVNVDAGAPDVRVQQQPPQVTVQQQPPEVTITRPEPEVTVRQAEPQVTINQGEPQVVVRQAEPQVEVRQGGQPEVQVLDAGEEAEVNIAGQRAEQDSEQQARPQQGRELQQRSASNLGTAEAYELIGNSIVTADGEEVGEIEAVARSRTGDDLYVIADVGGFFGIGERTVAVPLERAGIDSEGNLVTQMSRDEIEQLGEYDQDQFVGIG